MTEAAEPLALVVERYLRVPNAPSGKTVNGNQIEFVNYIVNHLTQHGVMDASRLYESPFTDLTSQGPDGLFTAPQIDELISAIEKVRAIALPA